MTQDMTLTGSESPLSCGAASVVPHTALVLSQIDSAHGQTMLVAQHRIYETPQGWAMGSADVLDPRGVMDIVRRMDNEAAMHSGPQYLPSNLLAQSDDLLIWHVASSVRPMFFLMPGSRRAVTLDVVWPSLVFCARGGSLRLFATATTKRPEPTTPLFQAPLMNHNPVRGLCFGSVPGHNAPTYRALRHSRRRSIRQTSPTSGVIGRWLIDWRRANQIAAVRSCWPSTSNSLRVTPNASPNPRFGTQE